MNNPLLAIQRGIEEAAALGHSPLWLLRGKLAELWDPPVVRPAPPKEVRFETRERPFKPLGPVSKILRPEANPREVRRPPPWFLGMSREFVKAIAGLDRKLQGRILEAIADISEDPTTPRGDTKKALRADFDGCWRFRIGDFRLIYSADQSSGNITLVAFAGRGSIYED